MKINALFINAIFLKAEINEIFKREREREREQAHFIQYNLLRHICKGNLKIIASELILITTRIIQGIRFSMYRRFTQAE